MVRLLSWKTQENVSLFTSVVRHLKCFLCDISAMHTQTNTERERLHRHDLVYILFSYISLQERRVFPSGCPWLSCTSPAVKEKDKVLRWAWMCVQLPERHPILRCWFHHNLQYQWLWLHRNMVSARQSECKSILFSLFLWLKITSSCDCLPLQVCVVGGVVHPVGSTWEEGCEKCSCTQLKDKTTSLHLAQCIPPVCDRTCPQVRHAKCQTWIVLL